MATIIDARELLELPKGKGLPTEALFVDTNIVILHQNPFHRDDADPDFARRSQLVTQIIQVCKDRSWALRSTLSVAIEFYKHLQHGFYELRLAKREDEASKESPRRKVQFDPADFKRRYETDPDFREKWQHRRTNFAKVFRKTFPMLSEPGLLAAVPEGDLFDSFKKADVDFGDHVLYKTAWLNGGFLFSADRDFRTYDDEHLKLLTWNMEVIKEAQALGRLASLSKYTR